MEKIAQEAGPGVGGRLWFQLYVWNKREMSYQLIERAHRAGFEALIVTVDTIVPPNREYNTHNGFIAPYKPNVTIYARHHAPSGVVHQRADEISHAPSACRATRTIRMSTSG